MRAALRLRLLEARRRGGLRLLALAMLAVLAVSLLGGETVAGRYGAATDVAATLSYVAAIFLGAFPIAMDRERRRSYLPGASPVTPWGWALGNALGAAIPVLLFAVCVYAIAAAGAAMRGGIETYRVTSFGRAGNVGLPTGPEPRSIEVHPRTTSIRFTPRVYLLAERSVGTEDAAEIAVDGQLFRVYHERPVTIPVRDNPVRLSNLSPDHFVAIDLASFRARYDRMPFSPNALLAAVPPALGAAALAALGVAAGAHLGTMVAALVLTLLLLLASMRGFLLDVIEYEGTLRRAREETHAGHAGHAGQEHHGHDHGPVLDPDAPGRAFAKGAVKGLLDLVPSIGELDRTGEVATGEWVGDARIGRGAALMLIALGFAAVAGGVGVFLRRTP